MRLNAEHSSLGDRILKVNHAGENGAVNIYAGQRIAARLTARSMDAQLAEFKSHEENHRAIFLAELQRRGLRRCRSYWLCAIGGLALGVATGLLGRRAIAATTVAVEAVVLRHLREQLRILEGKDAAAVAAISAILEDEQRHHDLSFAHLGAGRFRQRLIMPVVAASTETVIWLGMRL